MKKISSVLILVFLFHLVSFSKGIESSDLQFNLIIKESEYDPNYVFGSLGVNMAVDKEGFIYLLDAQDGFVKKYDINGKYLLKFGRRGDGPGEFEYTSTFSNILNGNLVYYNGASGLVNVFNNNGKLITSFKKDPFLQDPYFLKSDNVLFKSHKTIKEKPFPSMEYRLILLNKDKPTTIKSINDGHYRQHLPRTGKRTFQDNRNFCEFLTYTIDLSGNIYYAVSNDYKIWKYSNGKSSLVISEKINPIPITEKYIRSRARKMEVERGKILKADYYVTVPDNWQLIYKILTDDKNNIWVCAKSKERNGLVKYSPSGKFLKYYRINLISTDVEYTLNNFLLFIWKDNIYVNRYDTENGVEIYLAKIKE